VRDKQSLLASKSRSNSEEKLINRGHRCHRGWAPTKNRLKIRQTFLRQRANKKPRMLSKGPCPNSASKEEILALNDVSCCQSDQTLASQRPVLIPASSFFAAFSLPNSASGSKASSFSQPQVDSTVNNGAAIMLSSLVRFSGIGADSSFEIVAVILHIHSLQPERCEPVGSTRKVDSKSLHYLWAYLEKVADRIRLSQNTDPARG